MGICIISGLAIGIDTIAHINSMQNEGKTIAVIASGLNKIYPTENKVLAENIIKNGGAIVSEWEQDEDVEMSRFPRRNRIISGLADLILVIEAKYRSGSTITARCGFKQKKEVACIPGNVNQKNSYGTNKLLQEGAELVMSVQDVLDLLGDEKELKPQIDGRFKEIYDNLCALPQTADEISKRVNKKISEVSGGERTKIAFIKLLLSKPDLLSLDEPTNHLDITTIEWLETYLKNRRIYRKLARR